VSAVRVLITGGEGFIGTATRRLLQARGHDVVTLDTMDPIVHGTPPDAAHAADADGTGSDHRFVRGDVRDPDAVRSALEGADAVLHLAAEGGLGRSMTDPRPFTDANVTGTATLLEALRGSSARRLVVASSVGVYGEGAYECAEGHAVGVVTRPRPRPTPGTSPGPGGAAGSFEVPCPACRRPLVPLRTPESHPAAPTSVYSVTKLATEQLAVSWSLAYGLPTVALRYFCTYGPGQSMSNPYTGLMTIFLARIAAGEPPLVFEDGLQTRDFVFVDDVAMANVLALEAEGDPAEPASVLNVGTGVATTVLEVARTVCELTGFDRAPEVTGRRRLGDVRHIVADPSRAERALGWRASIDLRTGLERTLAWARGRPSTNRLEDAIAELERRGLMA
jgi:dTDP-L-rhamnose 4-epimerase